MEKDLVNKIINKEYIELSANELTEIQPYCNNEDEFNQMKEVFTQVAAVNFSVPTPKKETKQSLDALFDEKFAKVTPAWYMSVVATLIPKEKPIYKQPLVQIAAVCLLLLFAVPFFQNDIVISPKEQIAKVEVEKVAGKNTITPSIASTKTVETNQNNEIENFKSTIETPDLSTTSSPFTETSSRNSGDEAFGNGFAFTEEIIVDDATNFIHSDLIVDVVEEDLDYSITAADVPNVLDLLTTTF